MTRSPLPTETYLKGAETTRPQELAYGVVREAAAPTARHQQAVGDLYTFLRACLEKRRLGRVWMAPLDVVLDPARALVVQPDLVAVFNERLPIVSDRIWGAPDLVVEVLSPFPRIGDIEERLGWFAQYGVRECWLVRHLCDEFEIVSFADGAVATRTRFGPHDTLRSGVLLDLDITPSGILSDL